MTKQICELSIGELDVVSGGGFNIGRPFLPSIIMKPTSDPTPTGTTTTSTTYPKASFDPVTVRFSVSVREEVESYE